jgi:hypothetical protein
MMMFDHRKSRPQTARAAQACCMHGEEIRRCMHQESNAALNFQQEPSVTMGDVHIADSHIIPLA